MVCVVSSSLLLVFCAVSECAKWLDDPSKIIKLTIQQLPSSLEILKKDSSSSPVVNVGEDLEIPEVKTDKYYKESKVIKVGTQQLNNGSPPTDTYNPSRIVNSKETTLSNIENTSTDRSSPRPDTNLNSTSNVVSSIRPQSMVHRSSNSSRHVPVPVSGEDVRNIIDAPERKCDDGERRDAGGICRKVFR